MGRLQPYCLGTSYQSLCINGLLPGSAPTSGRAVLDAIDHVRAACPAHCTWGAALQGITSLSKLDCSSWIHASWQVCPALAVSQGLGQRQEQAWAASQPSRVTTAGKELTKWRLCGAVHLMCSCGLAPLDTSSRLEIPAGSSHRDTKIWAHSHFSCQRLFAHGAPGALWVDR